MEHDSASQSQLRQLKEHLRIIQAGKLTVKNDFGNLKNEIIESEKSLMNYVIQENPTLFPEMVSYWLFQKFHMEAQASNYVTHKTDYSETVEFVFKCYEDNPNLTSYSSALFNKWL